MAELQNMTLGQGKWDEVFNKNLELMGGGSTTYSDTGYVTEGITLLNGAVPYSTDFQGDKPSFRIIQKGSFEALIIKGAIKGLSLSAGSNNYDVAKFPSIVADWITAHAESNGNWATTALDHQYSWRMTGDGTLKLSYNSPNLEDGFWVRIDALLIG